MFFHYTCVKQLIKVDYETYVNSPNLAFQCDDCTNNGICVTSVYEKLQQLLDIQKTTNQLVSGLTAKIGELENNNTSLREDFNEYKEYQLSKLVTPTWPTLDNNKSLHINQTNTSQNNNNTHSNNGATSVKSKHEIKIIKKQNQNIPYKTAVLTPETAVHTSDVTPKGILQGLQPEAPKSQTGSLPTGKHERPDADEFKEIKSKKNRRKAEVIGKSTEESEFSLKGIKRKAHLFLGRFELETTDLSVKNYISKKILMGVSPEEIEVVKLQSVGKSASFRASIPLDKLDLVKNADIWPNGVIVNRFYFKKTNFQEVNPVQLKS